MGGLRAGVCDLLGLAAEDLLLQPGDSGSGRFEFLGQFGDLRLLTTNDLLEFLSLVLPCGFPFDGPGMQRLVVMGLLAKLHFQATGFGISCEHTGMVYTSSVRVQPRRRNSQSAPKRTTGSLNVYVFGAF